MDGHLDIGISVQNVYKEFKGTTVLRDVSRDFEVGKIHGIVGSNGSGKTVLFKCICGFMFPSKGRILVDYQVVGRDMDFPEDMGLIIETPGFNARRSGFQELKFLASLRGKISEKQIWQTIQKVGLDPASKKHIGKYSLGMRQRLGLAQAIMENPRFLILDEPFNGLDKTGAAEMRELLKNLRSDGRTILLASHNALDIEELCDTVCEMDAGVLTPVR